jgi:UDP-glucose 4-epimerase
VTTRTLVTGGAGFIGSHVAHALVRAGHEVVILDDLSGGVVRNIPPGAHLHVGSVADPDAVDALFDRFSFDHVFHLAAYAAEGLSHFIRRFNYTNNVVGSVNLINAAVNAGTVKCFVFTSSIAVYGAGQLPMTEDMTPAPEDPYGIAKYAVELDLRAAHEMFGLPYVVFRPHNVYGERQNTADKYRNVIGIFMNQALRGEPMTVFGDGTQTRAFTHVDDVAGVIARSIDVPAAYGQVFNVGGDAPYTVNELATVVSEVMDVPVRVEHLAARNEVQHAVAGHAKLHGVFGAPERPVDLRAGLARMADWVRAHGPQDPAEFSAIEVARNLPPSWRVAVGGRV